MKKVENMSQYTVELDALANRTRMGDANARQELRERLEPVLFQNVRRVLKHGILSTSLSERILKEYRRLGTVPFPSEEVPRHLMKQISNTICNQLIDRLESAPDRRHLLETVLA